MAIAHINQHNKKDSDKTNEIQNSSKETAIHDLLDKTEEVLRAGGLHAETLIMIIVKFHERFYQEAHR